MTRALPSRLRAPAQLAALVATASLVMSCAQTDYIVRSAARITSAWQGGSTQSDVAVASATNEELPPEQVYPGFDFESLGASEDGTQRFRVRIKAGGSPSGVAFAKLTPLFDVDGKDAPTFVSEAFFAANPHRTPRTIQPGDTFILELPADAFVVRWSEEREELFGGRARVQESVSYHGDRLRFYLTDPFPVRHELMEARRPGVGVVHLSGELAYLLSTGRTDIYRLAQLVYRVTDPDMFQVEQIRSLVADLSPGEELSVEIDRTRTYMDPVREMLPGAKSVSQVADPAHALLNRYTFEPDGSSPYAAVEDALGTYTDISALPAGKVFRVEYGWEGTVRVSYRTGPDDARGKRDALQLREDEHWARVYREIGGMADPPVRWSAGQPADLHPFPSARDPRQKAEGGELPYDFLLPGRALMLTFHPIRWESDVRAEREIRDALQQVQEQLRGSLEGARRSSAADLALGNPGGSEGI